MNPVHGNLLFCWFQSNMLCHFKYDCLAESAYTGQVFMQTLVLVALFRQQTREKIIAWIEWVLPDRIPGLWGYLGLTATPAELLHDYIRRRIAEFQEGVTRRAAAQALDSRSV